MRQSERNKRNHIIVGLCAILVIMAVGFAAFSTSLNINSSAGITGTWCVGFDSSEGSVTPTKGPKTATSPTGSISYTGSTCLSSYRGGVSLSASLYQPGDFVTYTLTIKNASSLAAAINSVNVGGSNVNKNTTITKGNITFTVNMPLDTSLSASESTTMSITATFQNTTNITGPYNGESQSLDVSVNTSQDTGSGGFTPAPSRTIDQTFVPQYYEYHTGGGDVVVGDAADTTNWVQDSTELTGRNYFLGHDVEGGNVTANYACFVIYDIQYCMKASDDGSTFSSNKGLLETLKYEGAITCSNFDNSIADCSGGGLGYLIAYWDGDVSAGASSSANCYATNAGCSICDE